MNYSTRCRLAGFVLDQALQFERDMRFLDGKDRQRSWWYKRAVSFYRKMKWPADPQRMVRFRRQGNNG